jgi:hypothetical protein
MVYINSPLGIPSAKFFLNVQSREFCTHSLSLDPNLGNLRQS